MTPCAWTFDVVLFWSSFPEGSDTEGTWVIGITTFNLVGQGPTPEAALKLLLNALKVTASGFSPHEAFRVRTSSDVPIHDVCEHFDEVRITTTDQATNKSARYIMRARFSLPT